MGRFSRNINVTVEDAGANFEATASMLNQLEGSAFKGTFKITVIVSKSDFEITEVKNVEINGLFPSCSETIADIKKISGIKIGPGYNKQIFDKIGGEKGCTHITELLGEIGRCVFQAYHYNRYETDGVEACIKEYREKSKISCVGLSKYGNK